MKLQWKRWYTPPLVIAGLLAGALALWKWSPDVPKWAQQNTGPWVLGAAVIAFTGVWLTIRAQGHNADNDRRERRDEAERAHERALEVAREERAAQELRAHADREHQASEAERDRRAQSKRATDEREHHEFRTSKAWYREKRLDAYSEVVARLLDVTGDEIDYDRYVALIGSVGRASAISPNVIASFLHQSTQIALDVGLPIVVRRRSESLVQAVLYNEIADESETKRLGMRLVLLEQHAVQCRKTERTPPSAIMRYIKENGGNVDIASRSVDPETP